MTVYDDDMKERYTSKMVFPLADIRQYLSLGSQLTLLEDKRTKEGHEQRQTIFVVVSEEPLGLRVAASTIKKRD